MYSIHTLSMYVCALCIHTYSVDLTTKKILSPALPAVAVQKEAYSALALGKSRPAGAAGDKKGDSS